MVERGTRRRTLALAYLLAVGLFTWLGLRGRLGEVGDALAATTPRDLLAGLLLVGVGLTATGLLWLRLMRCLGASLPVVDGSAVFFLGQLGKYIPGSVWSVGAQAELARRHEAGTRATVAAGLLFLGIHVDTAVVLACLAVLAGGLDTPWAVWLTVVALVAAIAGLVPPVIRALVQRAAGREPSLGWSDVVAAIVLMTVAWSAYSASLVVLSPGHPWDEVLRLGGAFAAAYAAGVLVVLAPAGVGAREAVFVLLAAPVTGVAEATALALLARVAHTAADASLAAGWWFVARTSPNLKVGVTD